MSEFSERPKDVGILAIEMYTPKRYVSQVDMEIKDNCKGKYTVGLGQLNMAFVDDREDITSIFLTAVTSLLRKYDIDPMQVRISRSSCFLQICCTHALMWCILLLFKLFYESSRVVYC